MKPDIIALDRTEINTLPLKSYEGEICIINSYSQLLKFLPLLKNETITGFDTETKPTFRKGHINMPALIQLACKDIVFLIKLNQVTLVSELIELLESPKIIKTGVGIKEDLNGLKKLKDFNSKNIIDLGNIAQQHNIGVQSLRGLTASLLGFRISKTAQCSNWNQPELSQQQIKYAATDAWVSRELYIAFKKHKLITE
ncbi:3'-5' exonuclease [Desulfovibrio litoralis]|uniref:3'-5' exonuclease n=1 Tax=Desulfovibrio litoralis DSM 11393 TaxID=1121455 RepID=A0A1M7TN49_9BACT|nr:3'-5' exonuclease [Desulfovibrio litoralis]SHN72135.1 3'-5' exonuclease [Desulfovibrio litoralis DSM 11393]